MDICSKVGTYIVSLKPAKPDIKLINYLTMDHAPLTPDLFPYYAGTWTEDPNASNLVNNIYDDWIVNERNQRLENEVNEDGTLILPKGDNPFADMQKISSISSLDNENNDNLELINNSKIDDKVLSDYNEQRERDLKLLDEMNNVQIKEISNKYSDLTKNQTNISNNDSINDNSINNHEQMFNDLSTKNNSTISISEPISNIKVNNVENKASINLNANQNQINELDQQKTELINNQINQNKNIINNVNLDLPDIGHEPIFVTTSKNNDEYYDSVLAEYDKLLKNK